VRARRFVLDLAIVMVFVPFAICTFAPITPGLDGHPLFYLDPFLSLGLIVAGILPPILLAVFSLVVLCLCYRVRLVFCRFLCPFGACQRLVWIRPLGILCGRWTGGLPRLGTWVLMVGVALGLFGALSLSSLDPLVQTAHGVHYLASLVDPSYGPVGVAMALPFLVTLVVAVGIYVPFCRCVCPVKPWPPAIPRPSQPTRGTKVSRTTRRIPVLRARPFSRRQLFVGTSAIAVGTGAWWFRSYGVAAIPSVLRPPGALPGRRFLDTCIRCGQCQSACPTGIIRPSGFDTGLDGLLAPMLDFSRGVCPPRCVACQRVCPTGALAFLNPQERRLFKIGLARSRPDLCVRTKGKLCRLCLEACPFNAIAVGVPGQPNAPRIEDGLCVGCGICENICPVAKRDGGPAIRVYPEWEV